MLPITVLVLVPICIERNITFHFGIFMVIGLILMAAGLFVLIMINFAFVRIGKGTLAPWSPTKKLVTTGLYRYVRNPMILGVLTILTGESIAFLSLKILVWTVIFFFIHKIYFVVYEEKDLEKKFGDEYREYKKNVPRWIPATMPYKH